MARAIRFWVHNEDVLRSPSDVLALKSSDRPRGADLAVLQALKLLDPADPVKVKPGEHLFVETNGALSARQVLFVGVPPLYQLSYADIRKWAYDVISALTETETRSLTVTLHGPGFGLDTRESFLSELAGFIDAIKERKAPPTLERVIVVERSDDRTARLEQYLKEALPSDQVEVRAPVGRPSPIQNLLASFGEGSQEKKSVFVAMPFAKEFRNTYDYGIEKPVQESGYLCERIDNEQFAGDIRAKIQEDISKSDLVIADLSGNNPNVYLEVGYAWGKAKPTLFIARDGETPTFDVAGHKTIRYSSDDIKGLEQEIRKFLQAKNF